MNIWTFVTTTYIVLQIESIELTHTPDKSLFNVHLLRQRRSNDTSPFSLMVDILDCMEQCSLCKCQYANEHRILFN